MVAAFLLNQSSVENRAGCVRIGCEKKVVNGMLCEKYETWNHEKCTGLLVNHYKSR